MRQVEVIDQGLGVVDGRLGEFGGGYNRKSYRLISHGVLPDENSQKGPLSL